MAFYKIESESQVLKAPTFVHMPNGARLSADAHEGVTYPVQGWYWFDSDEAATAALSLNESQVESLAPPAPRPSRTIGGGLKPNAARRME